MDQGQQHAVGLGPLHTVPLADARRRAAQLRLARLDGADLMEGRRTRRVAAITQRQARLSGNGRLFDSSAAEYLLANQQRWKDPKDLPRLESMFRRYVLPLIGKVPVDDIDTQMILKVLDQPVAGKPGTLSTTHPSTAQLARSHIERIIDFANAAGWRNPDRANPARWQGHIERLRGGAASLAKTRAAARANKGRAGEHHDALPYAEIAQFLAELRHQDNVAVAPLLMT